LITIRLLALTGYTVLIKLSYAIEHTGNRQEYERHVEKNTRFRQVILYQTRKTVFVHISKHQEETRNEVFLANFEVFDCVWKCGQISSQSQLKLKRKRRKETVKI